MKSEKHNSYQFSQVKPGGLVETADGDIVLITKYPLVDDTVGIQQYHLEGTVVYSNTAGLEVGDIVQKHQASVKDFYGTITLDNRNI